jgi:signal transduction histidine kinase/CheY-like chemotaxis protein
MMQAQSHGSPQEQVEILIVDDREENLLALEAVLASPEYHLVRAQSGDSALRYLLDHDPALILMDVQMPGLDGFATAAIIKGSSRTRDIPIIFLTAIGKEERFVHRGYEHGAVDYMTKPFDSHILQSKVAVFADLHRKNQSLLKAERRIREVEKRDRERRIAELELKSLRREQIEQKKYRDLVEGIQNGIVWSADPTTMRFSFVSQPAERLLGFPSQEWLVRDSFWEQRLPPDDRAPFRQALLRAASDEGSAELEHRLLNAMGRPVWFRTGLRSEAGEDGKLEIRGLSVEITASKEASRLLQLRKTRSDLLARAGLVFAESFDYQKSLPKLAEGLVAGYADWAEISILKEGSTMEAMAVAHSDPLTSRRARALAAKWKEAPLRDTRAEGLYGKVASLSELALNEDHLAFLGTLEIGSAISLPLQTRGKVIGSLLLGRALNRPSFQEGDHELAQDLAFRIASSVDNWRLYQEAELAIRVRDEFLSIASHELKTPLTPLKIQTQQLLRLMCEEPLQNLDPVRIEKMLTTSNRQIERLSKLIDDLLDISRINTGKLQLNLEHFDLMEMIGDIRQRFASQLSSSGCELVVHGPGALPVYLDLFRIEQVVVNLLTNAMKYGPGQPIEISISRAGDFFSMAVKDGGIGIAAEDQKRIFLRFERAVSSTHFGGLGLGLYIVTQILEAHGGGISVSSEEKRGSVFRVELPMAAKIPASRLSQTPAPASVVM